jgi:DNA-binding winged helix-turn-helix (wHTH) protein/Tol biopolymer transport system component
MEIEDLLQFGPFRVDPVRRVLLRDGQTISLPGKAFDVLLVLLQKPGETVTKDDLMKAVWPDTFVEEGNLTQTIFVLRKSLGDSDGQPLIVTVPRQGYRFAGTVTAGATRAESPSVASTPRNDWFRVLTRNLQWAGWVVALGLAAWMLMGPRGGRDRAAGNLVRFTIAAPAESFFREGRVSPDGEWLAFIGYEIKGRKQLWLQRLDSLSARPLSPAEGTPIWSPDSRFIAFGDHGKLKKIALSGGVPAVICDAPLVIGGSWSRTNNIIFGGGGENEIVLAPAGGGAAKSLTRLDARRGENQHAFPVFLPDGHHFIFTIQSDRPEYGGVFVASLEAPGERVRLVKDVSNAEYATTAGSRSPAEYLLFVRDDALMAQPFAAASRQVRGEPLMVLDKVVRRASIPGGSFSASTNGVLLVSSPVFGNQLTWFDRSGQRTGTIGEPGLYLSPSISPDEKSLIVDRLEPVTFSTNVWLFPVAGNPSRFTFSPSQLPVWSPDGKRIAYETLDTAIYEKPASGTGDQTMLLEPSQISPAVRVPCDWSRDGRFLIYAEMGKNTGFDLWKLPTAGDRKPAVLLNGEFNEFCGAASPDGRLVAYSSDQSGRNEVYVQFLPEEGPVNGRKWQVSYSGGTWPRWRRDGKELFYLDGKRNMIAVDVQRSSFEAATSKLLFATGIQTPDARFDVTADGKRFIVPTETSGENTMLPTVILNWTNALRP